MSRSSLLRSAALLAVCGLALIGGAWFAITSREPVEPPLSAAIQPREPYGEVGGRPRWLTEHLVLRAQLWSERFRALEERQAWEELSALLADIEERAPVLYRSNRLGYLHARALLGEGDDDQAAEHLEPFLAAGDPYRPLALHHAADLAKATGDDAGAATRRRQLVLEYPGSLYWHDTLVEHLEWLEGAGDPQATLGFVAAVEPLTDEARVQRELAAARVGARIAAGDLDAATAEGSRLLAQSTGDDAAERVAVLLDRPAVLRALAPATLRDVADTMLHHRQWDRAVELFELARRRSPEDRGELDFSMGRARFFAEEYAEAERLYRRAAGTAGSRGAKARALYHAARAAQLRGHDAEAESLLGQAIAVPGRYESTAAAITSRIRLRVHRGNMRGARSDLALLRRTFPGNRVVAEGAVALAMGELATGRATAAGLTLQGLPTSLGAYDRAEVTYWRARAAETREPTRALAGYLAVLRTEVPTHFAYLARHRLAREPLSKAAAALAAQRRRQARASLQRGDAAAARRLQTDAVLLTDNADADLRMLREIYRALPKYRAVMEARPLPLPSFPLRDAAPDELLAAMGLYDETVQATGRRYPLTPFHSGLTRSIAYRRGAASRASISAAESLMQQVPDDFVPQLLPRELRELLYPRYFYDQIADDAETYGADPRLLLAIMREESRFNPRAKSSAAARGLLQLLLSTARQVAEGLGLVEVAPEDLYDPHLVIQLGAKYLGDLLGQLDNDPYAAAAAYNAGPKQARVWLDLAPAKGHDYFLSTVSFSETRHYVRKVLNSYERYGEIYQGEPPTGGVRAEP